MEKAPKIEIDLDMQAQNEIICPPDLKKLILEEIEKEQKIHKDKLNKQKKKAQTLSIRVYNKLEVKTIKISCKKSFKEFENQVFEQFQIDNRDNCRLRLFNRIRDEMLGHFTDKMDQSLEKLKINSVKCFMIEEKNEGQEFENYDPEIGNSQFQEFIYLIYRNIQNSIL